MKQLKEMKELCIGVGLGMSISSLFIYGSMKPGMITDANPPGDSKGQARNQTFRHTPGPATEKKTYYILASGTRSRIH